MRVRRQHHVDWVARANQPARSNDRHDPRFSNDLALRSAIEHGRQQARPEPFDLSAGITQSVTDSTTSAPMRSRVSRGRPSRSRPSVVMFSPRSAAVTSKPLLPQFCEELGLQEMHLTQVRLGRIDGDARAVLDRHALMGIALDATSRDDLDVRFRSLGKGMPRVFRDGNDAALDRRRRFDDRGCRAAHPTTFHAALRC